MLSNILIRRHHVRINYFDNPCCNPYMVYHEDAVTGQQQSKEVCPLLSDIPLYFIHFPQY